MRISSFSFFLNKNFEGNSKRFRVDFVLVASGPQCLRIYPQLVLQAQNPLRASCRALLLQSSLSLRVSLELLCKSAISKEFTSAPRAKQFLTLAEFHSSSSTPLRSKCQLVLIFKKVGRGCNKVNSMSFFKLYIFFFF